MLIASACVLYRAMTYDRSWPETKVFTTLLILSLSAVVAYHVATDEQVVHELAFVLLILLVGLRTRFLIKTRVKNEAQQAKFRRNTIFGAGTDATLHVAGTFSQRLVMLTRLDSLLRYRIPSMAIGLSILL